MSKAAVIIGAGPAGLTAAYELLKRTDIVPIILEKSGDIGGISKTINYKGNRMDMGPHRFFSKSDRVMNWWLNIMPLKNSAPDNANIHYQNKTRTIPANAAQAKDPEKVMLIIQRLTRIYFLRKFFAYPIQLTFDTLRTLGPIRTIKILFSFVWTRLFPRKPEKSLEDFIINKFGRQLYLLFFKDYTEKVWGMAPSQISAEWGAQRIKGVSLSKAIGQAIKSMRNKKKGGIAQKDTETSLIEQFLYPKYGPGSLWEEVARQVQEMGGKIYLHQDVQSIEVNNNVITSLTTLSTSTDQTTTWQGDYFFSSMPVQELIAGMGAAAPVNVQEIAAGLQYRDFINVGILLRQLSDKDGRPLELKDNWIYIQERDVKVGRLMIYNNWGDGMIKDPNTTWIGMEYFCNKTDAFWALDDEAIETLAIQELEKMQLANAEDVLDTTVRRMEKTYPAYFGTYDRFDQIRAFTDTLLNLFLIGRNGMHKYNNADHSMLTAMTAVDNIHAGVTSKANLWAINTEQEYHEQKSAPAAPAAAAPIPKPVPAPQPTPSFIDYVWRNRWNRAYLVTAAIVWLIQFILFKFRYPFANYMPDSYSYIEAAYTNADVNMWPVAYSKFLRLISVFTHSDKIVIVIQYIFMQFSGTVFLFSLLHFLQPGKMVKGILCTFFLLNPITLYVANYISADALFVGLSLLWLSSLLWIICNPRSWQIGVQAILLLACFTVRYNAIYYPFISIIAFITSKQRWAWKLTGITIGTLLVSISILYTSFKMQDITGYRLFSAFSGWQLANDALYMYEHIPSSHRKPVPQEFSKLEKMVRQHLDTIRRVKLTKIDSSANFFYLWDRRGPLIQYMARKWTPDSNASYFKKWSSEGGLYFSYGLYLIKEYPVAFGRFFVIPNTFKYLYPPPEFLGTYNMGLDSVDRIAKNWFNYKTLKIANKNSPHAVNQIVQFYSYFATLVNTLVFICLLGLLLITKLSTLDKNVRNTLLLCGSLLVINFVFSIAAAPVVLRYQIFPIMVGLPLCIFICEALYNYGKRTHTQLASK